MADFPILDLVLERDGADVTMLVRGELDLATAPQLADRLDAVIAEVGGGDVTVDLAGVGFVDSTALRVLMAAHQDLRAASRRLVLARPTAATRRVLEISGLLETFELDDQDE